MLKSELLFGYFFPSLQFFFFLVSVPFSIVSNCWCIDVMLLLLIFYSALQSNVSILMFDCFLAKLPFGFFLSFFRFAILPLKQFRTDGQHSEEYVNGKQVVDHWDI